MDKGRLLDLKAYSKSLKRFINVVVWYPNEEDKSKWQIYFSTDDSMSTKDVIDCYRTRFQLEYCFRDAKHYAGLNDCQSTDLRKLEFHRTICNECFSISRRSLRIELFIFATRQVWAAVTSRARAHPRAR